MLYGVLGRHPISKYQWSKFVKSILDNTVTYVQIPLNLHITVKQILFDQFKQSWSASLTISSKGLNYNTIKDSLSF